MDSRFQRVKSDENEPYPPSEVWRIWKNVLALGFAFMILFTAFWGASNLQSSINADEALGTFTLASIYASLILSNIFLPVIVIKWFGCKWTASISVIAYMPFIIAQFYPKFYTMIPAGLAVGFGGGPLWCAKCTYLTVAAEAYSQITGISSDVIVTRFFGVFFMFYQFSQVWGNLISSAVLSNGAGEPAIEIIMNATKEVMNGTIGNVVNVCGANFEPSIAAADANPNLAPPPMSKIHLIAGIYLACMIAACLIIAFAVDSLSRYDKGRTGSGSGLSGTKLLAVTMKQLANPYQLLILPITMFIGAEQAFIAADFNASFVSCGWGISNIGFVMICFGICNAISALFTGSIVKITGRSPVIAFALALHVALIVVLLVWQPEERNKYMYFLVAGLWGVADAVWLVQINSLSGILFPGKEEAAYSNFRLWEATGSVITYAYSPYLNTRIKIYLLLGLLFVGVSGYTAVEFLELKTKHEKIDGPVKGKFELVQAKEGFKSGEIAE
ncbi:PREDICTED: UNC93-like protein [Nicrophorus vespilloides]|uniref:UNC93-like protein n=1 Tax=Nicrophorus vespilloides TaxID=110193 RepID=A0ABM1M9R5_NICVS|nr:PREDICTED: UNC93-like protein [Nicrophorus vespilloides]